MKNKWSIISGLLVVCFMLPVGSGVCSDKVYEIGIATIATHPALDATRDGFLEEMAEQGFVDGKNVRYEFGNAEGDMSLAASITQKFVSQKKDLILAITTPISQAAVAAAKNTDIPIIFTAVTDPVAAHLVDSWEKPGGNVTGASDWMDVGHQIGVIKETVPNVTRLGVIYNSGEVNSVVQVNEMKKAAEALGIKKVVEANVSSTADVMLTTKTLVGRVDAIWVPTDNIVINALEAVIKVCEDNDIPLFGSDTNQVPRGLVASSGINMTDVGRESGRMAAEVLRGKNPGEIPVSKGIMSNLAVNPTAAERMGVTIPESVMKKATEIINN
jgi:putative ABC transport system substrate-binding protein